MPGVAYAVVRSEPPQVFLATDVDVLHRVLAAELVARTPSDVLTSSETEAIRRALLDERLARAAHGALVMRARPVADPLDLRLDYLLELAHGRRARGFAGVLGSTCCFLGSFR